jgi:enamine deaminase RidA (YjgF/YER057c/UK114 family)
MTTLLSLADLDRLDIPEAQRLPRPAREALLDLVLAAGRKVVNKQPERQVGIIIDGIEEDLTRLLKLDAVRIACSGFIPVDEHGEVPSLEPRAQFRLCFENVKATLGRLGTSTDRVTSLFVFLKNMDYWAEMNVVYREYFRLMPARAAIGAASLNRTYQIEVAGLIAYKIAER